MEFIDFFAGIGGFRRGMELAGHECIGFCEFDRYAVASYTMMHLVTEEQRKKLLQMPMKKRLKELKKEEYRNGDWYANDVRAVDARSMPRADCWCFGFPCQDISVAGNQLGFAGKRSSLFFAVTGLIRDLEAENRPSTLFIENVKNLLSVNGGFDFAKLLIELDEIGYDAEWSVLNSKDFGVPQNRERVFIIGHLRGRCGREVFPLREPDKIYNTAREDEEVYKVAQCLTSGGNDKWGGDYIVKRVGNVNPSGNGMNGNVFDSNGLCPSITTNKGEGNKIIIPDPDSMGKQQNRQSVMVREATKQGYAIAQEGDSINLAMPSSTTRRGRIGKGVANTLDTSCNQGVAVLRNVRTEFGKQIRKDYEAKNIDISRHEFLKLEPRCDGITNTLSTVQKDNLLADGLRIRRLTPKECFRLQGWTDEYYERAKSVNADS